MPTVPDTFAPGVSQGDMPAVPANGPWVAPMRNAAPGQLLQTSQTTSGVGAEEMRLGNTIGDRVQETMDDATTKAAENQFLQSALPALGSYKTTEGINATNQYDPTAQAISKARQDARTQLTNPIQQRMYDQVTNQHMLAFGDQMADHEAVQRVEYGKKQSSDRADSLNGLARMAYLGGDMSGYQKYSQQADAETLNYAQLSGATPDSDMAQAMLRAKRSDLAHSVVAGLLERHAVSEADQYFQDNQGNLDMHTSELLDGAIKSSHMQEDPKVDVERAAMSAAGIKGPGVLQPPIPAGTITTTQGVDGIDVHAAQGTKILAPGSGTVTKVWTDEQQGLSAQIALPNGYTATLSGLSAVNYKEGEKITVGQALGLSGADDSGRAVTHYAMTNPDGKFIDPRQASSAPLDPRNFSTPEAEEKAVDYINSNVADPEERQLAVRLARSTANGNRDILSQEHGAALKQATDYWFQNGQSLSGLPQNVSMQLTPEDVNSFSEKGKQEYMLNQSILGEREVNLLANWNAHPEQQTVDAVRQAYAQGQLSNSSYLTALRQATTMQDNPQKVQQVTLDSGQLTDILSLNQLPELAEPKTTAYKLQRVQLEGAIKNEIDLQEQKNNRPLSWAEKGKIVRDMVIDKVYTPGTFTTGNPTPVALVPPDKLANATVWVGGQKVRMMDIPPQYAQQATQDLQTNGVTPTQANIAAWWLRKGSPKQ